MPYPVGQWRTPEPHTPTVLNDEALEELSLMSLYPNAADLLATVQHLKEQLAEADHNAPWMTKAHMLCTDLNIDSGGLDDRLDALRAYLMPLIRMQPPKPDGGF